MCMTPFQVRNNKDHINQYVPCGRCPQCVARRISGWSFRLMQEDKVSQSSHFITLTYDTSNVPITRNGFMELRKRDVQLFFKRLRKLQASKLHGVHTTESQMPIKYYCAGEYGTKRKRPHYHIIMFNVQLELIQPAWNMGSVYYGTVTGASVGYTLKYMSKPRQIPMHRNDDRQPEFCLMSKGLGISYVNDRNIAWHHADHLNRMYLNLDEGKKCSMPRYYKEKIYTRLVRSEIAGFQKGELERKLLEEQEKHKDNATYWHNKNAAIGAAINQMYYLATRNRA